MITSKYSLILLLLLFGISFSNYCEYETIKDVEVYQEFSPKHCMTLILDQSNDQFYDEGVDNSVIKLYKDEIFVQQGYRLEYEQPKLSRLDACFIILAELFHFDSEPVAGVDK